MINGNLISGVHYDYAGNAYPIPQTMAGVEIDVDSDSDGTTLLASTEFKIGVSGSVFIYWAISPYPLQLLLPRDNIPFGPNRLTAHSTNG